MFRKETINFKSYLIGVYKQKNVVVTQDPLRQHHYDWFIFAMISIVHNAAGCL